MKSSNKSNFPQELRKLKNKNTIAIIQGIIAIVLLLWVFIFVIKLIIGLVTSTFMVFLAIVVIMVCPKIIKNSIKQLDKKG